MKANREKMNFDILIIGAGPSGLATAIRIAQLAKKNNQKLEICVLEKGSEIGSHIISGAVLDPKSLTELLPDWRKLGAPVTNNVIMDEFFFLTKNKSFKLPTPPTLNNKGNFIISLSNLCKWLGKIAEDLGVQIFPGFAAADPLYNTNNQLIGVATADLGVDKNNNQKSNFQPSIELHAKYTVLAEGCRGSITKQVIKKYNLDKNSCPQTYGLGIKEIWEIPENNHTLGKVIHSLGWPLDSKTYGGSFIYYMEKNLVSIGFVVGLDYKNPSLSPFSEFQRFKQHPTIKKLLKNGKRISYGAKSINEGGLQSIPKLYFPGGILVGCSAGFLNVPKIKGNHLAIKSGIVAADAIFENFTNYDKLSLPPQLDTYEINIKKSWIYTELKASKNIRPAFSKFGLYFGVLYSAIDTYILQKLFKESFWTFKNKHFDHNSLQHSSSKINYPKPDNILSFDKLTSVRYSNTFHEEDQPCHLKIKNNPENKLIPIDPVLEQVCPAAVYEIIHPEDQTKKPYLQINPQNCLHCKACDIKEPNQNIEWTTPEGGGGPRYTDT